MKKLFLVVVILVSSFLTSCTIEELPQEPKELGKPEVEQVQACCGEVGTLEDDPEED